MASVRLVGQGGYTHTQQTPSTMWLVEHNLGRVPLLEVFVNHQGILQKIQPKSIEQQSGNITKIHFSVPMTGNVRAL
jgi:hypothetical protein